MLTAISKWKSNIDTISIKHVINWHICYVFLLLHVLQWLRRFTVWAVVWFFIPVNISYSLTTSRFRWMSFYCSLAHSQRQNWQWSVDMAQRQFHWSKSWIMAETVWNPWWGVLLMLNWTDGTKGWFSGEGCKWIKRKNLCRVEDFSRRREIDLDKKIRKMKVCIWRVLRWALAAGIVCASLVCLCVTWTAAVLFKVNRKVCKVFILRGKWTQMSNISTSERSDRGGRNVRVVKIHRRTTVPKKKAVLI